MCHDEAKPAKHAESVVQPQGAGAPPPMAPAGDRLLTRAQAAALLGTSVSSIRRLEGGVLEPVVDPKGVHHFRESQVRELASREKRETAGPETYDGAMGSIARDGARRHGFSPDTAWLPARHSRTATRIEQAIQRHRSSQTKEAYQDDDFFITKEWAPRVRACRVIDNEVVRRVSDHGPIEMELDVGAT